jgi:hypothetical protein
MKRRLRREAGRWVMLPAQVEEAADRLKQKEGRGAVHAAMLELVAMGEARVECAMHLWEEKAMAWAVARKWLTTSKASTILRRAKAHIKQVPRDTLTILEMGSGWEGATEGLRQVIPRVVTWDMQSQVLGEKGRTSPEILGLFSRGGQKAVRWAAAKAGVSRKGARMLWVSLSCTHTSVANGMGRTQGTGNGLYGGVIEEADEVEVSDLEAVMDGVKDWQEAWPGGAWVVESPMWSSTRLHPRVRQEWEGNDLVRQVEVRGCCYGLLAQKPYRIITNLTAQQWTPRDWRSPVNGCHYCRTGSKHPQCIVPGQGDPRPRISEQGYTVQAARNRVPPALAAEIGASLVRAVT